MKDNSSNIVSKKEFYKGEEVEVQSRMINEFILQERFFFTNKNGTRIAKNIAKALGDNRRFGPNKDFVLAIRNSLGLTSKFLTCIPNEPMKEIIVYEFEEKSRRNIQQEKINRILDWVETGNNPEFNANFVYKMDTLLGRGELTGSQENSLDNIIEKWRIP